MPSSSSTSDFLGALVLRFTGVPFLFPLIAAAPSDFRGLPRRLTGLDSSGPFSGTVVVVVRVLRVFVGELKFSMSDVSNCGSASTVTLIFHGLVPAAFGVLRIVDFVGDGVADAVLMYWVFCEHLASGAHTLRPAFRDCLAGS